MRTGSHELEIELPIHAPKLVDPLVLGGYLLEVLLVPSVPLPLGLLGLALVRREAALQLQDLFASLVTPATGSQYPNKSSSAASAPRQRAWIKGLAGKTTSESQCRLLVAVSSAPTPP